VIEARHELLGIRHMASEMAYMTTFANAACPFNNNGLQLSEDMTESDELFLGRCLTSALCHRLRQTGLAASGSVPPLA
jgi:hypothetical protein